MSMLKSFENAMLPLPLIKVGSRILCEIAGAPEQEIAQTTIKTISCFERVILFKIDKLSMLSIWYYDIEFDTIQYSREERKFYIFYMVPGSSEDQKERRTSINVEFIP